jgi:quercetin dioxygenase-like cupin family protein
MLFEESKKATIRTVEAQFYEEQLRRSEGRGAENSQRRKIIKPDAMPWENSRQGLIKHLVNEHLNAQIESLDAYMQVIPAGSRSGKHRHMSEEYIFVLEGHGYDLHWDVDYEIGDRYQWKVDATASRWEWEQGDSIYIPPNTVHQHFNAAPDQPARLICATSRLIRLIGFDDLEQLENAPEYDAASPRGGA